MKKKNKGRTSRPKNKPASKGVLLDAFTEDDLEIWDTRSIDMQSYSDRVYYDLERQRAAHYDELCASLRAAPVIEISVDHWKRVTDYRWSLTPLSPAGSLKGIGGRFNIGSDLDRARGQDFPCLYIASDVDTAYREYFGGPISSRQGKLTLGEFALRRDTSFTTFALQGRLDQVFDLRDSAHLSKFAKIIARFDVSTDTQKFARGAKLPPRSLLRTATALWKRLLAPPAQWRIDPQMFGIPAPNQIFGRFIRDAGFEAVLYESQRGGAE